jgi:hypoxia up-regulated 1
MYRWVVFCQVGEAFTGHENDVEKGIKVHFRLDESGLLKVDKAEAVFERPPAPAPEKVEAAEEPSVVDKIAQFFKGEKEADAAEKKAEDAGADTDADTEAEAEADTSTQDSGSKAEGASDNMAEEPASESGTPDKSEDNTDAEPAAPNTETPDAESADADAAKADKSPEAPAKPASATAAAAKPAKAQLLKERLAVDYAWHDLPSMSDEHLKTSIARLFEMKV